MRSCEADSRKWAICQLVSSRFLEAKSFTLISGSRADMDGLVAYEVVRREMTVSSLRHRVWDPSTALHLAGPSRSKESRFATGTRVLLDTLRRDLACVGLCGDDHC